MTPTPKNQSSLNLILTEFLYDTKHCLSDESIIQAKKQAHTAIIELFKGVISDAYKKKYPSNTASAEVLFIVKDILEAIEKL